MNVGYVRLSKDDDRQKYVSIENQKLIISQYAAEHGMVIERWYEDDGVSGYQFDRPGFNRLLEDLDKEIDRILVKDFSRLGRHNARVLLLLDDLKERGKQLIVIDDHYDSMGEEDDTIGIKTWFNERYVKDTSKKIRRALEARQKAGTLLTQPPFGYRRADTDRETLEIVPAEAACIQMIFDLYLKGLGYRKIANHLTANQIATPSMARLERELAEGRISRRRAVEKWSDSMIKEILDNDFYTGTFRLRKRTRSTVHGKDRRIPKDEQCIFHQHHPAVIDEADFQLVQDIKKKRIDSRYRGSRRPWSSQTAETRVSHPFGGCLFCKDCKSRLTPIRRTSVSGERRYYICSVYNTKGKRFCSRSHLIEEPILMNDLIHLLRLCRNAFRKQLEVFDSEGANQKHSPGETLLSSLNAGIENRKKQLNILLAQKIRDLSHADNSSAFIEEAFDLLQQELLTQLHDLEKQLSALQNRSEPHPAGTNKYPNPLLVLDSLIEKGSLNREDIEFLIDRIEISQNGDADIRLRCGLSGLFPQKEQTQKEHSAGANRWYAGDGI